MGGASVAFAGIGLCLGLASVASPVQARPGWGGHGAARFYVASTFTWNQFNVVTSATGNSSQVSGNSGPVTVNQASGPVVVFGGLGGGGGGTSQGGGILPGLGLQGLTGLVNVGPGASGGLVNVNTGAVTVSPGSVGSGVTNGAPGGSTGGSTSGGSAGPGPGVGVGIGVSIPPVSIPPVSTPPVSVGVGLGAGVGAPVQVCATCLTGGVGG